eukprot:scaffold167249_cov36-Tisochrysis_lutea.AAC.2
MSTVDSTCMGSAPQCLRIDSYCSAYRCKERAELGRRSKIAAGGVRWQQADRDSCGSMCRRATCRHAMMVVNMRSSQIVPRLDDVQHLLPYRKVLLESFHSPCCTHRRSPSG